MNDTQLHDGRRSRLTAPPSTPRLQEDGAAEIWSAARGKYRSGGCELAMGDSLPFWQTA
jgi:hypothetical protein